MSVPRKIISFLRVPVSCLSWQRALTARTVVGTQHVIIGLSWSRDTTIVKLSVSVHTCACTRLCVSMYALGWFHLKCENKSLLLWFVFRGARKISSLEIDPIS